MEALEQSHELIRRGSELRAQSDRMRAIADEKMDKSRRLVAAAAKAREAVMRACSWEPAGRSGRAPATDVPAGRQEARDTRLQRSWRAADGVSSSADRRP